MWVLNLQNKSMSLNWNDEKSKLYIFLLNVKYLFYLN